MGALKPNTGKLNLVPLNPGQKQASESFGARWTAENPKKFANLPRIAGGDPRGSGKINFGSRIK